MTTTPKKPNRKSIYYARHRARQVTLQALYQWSMAGGDIKDIEIEFHQHAHMQDVDVTYFHELLHEIPSQLSNIDECIIPYLDRSINELNPIELIALRIATYELLYRLEVPYKVVLNEALELTKIFGTEEGYKYVNGVLDKICQQVRKDEITH